MITLLKSLHAIAAARGDGLLPEFLGPVSGGRIVPCRVVQVATLVAVLPGRSAGRLINGSSMMSGVTGLLATLGDVDLHQFHDHAGQAADLP